MKELFFQSSLPRAGSTLLQNILGQNPEFHVTPTSGLHDLVMTSRQVYTTSPNFKAQDADTMKKAFLGFVGGGLQGYFECVTDKPYVVDKSRGWINKIPFLELLVEEPKMICIIRDPRAIFASMEKNFRKHPDKDTSVYFPKEFVQNLPNRINHWANPKVFIGSAFNNLREVLQQKNKGKIHFVKYEDLMENPKQEMDKIYDYLGKKKFKHDFKNIEQITHEDDKFHGIFGDHQIQKEIKAVPADYEKILGIGLCNELIKTYKWFYTEFNYM